MRYSSSASLATAPLITLLSLAHFGTATPQAPTRSAYDSTPTDSLPQGPAEWLDRGCYVDNDNANPLMQQKMGNGAGDVFLTPAKCQNLCFLSGYDFAGLKGGQECWCAKSLAGKEADDGKCDAPCTGYAEDICGGKGYMSVHEAVTGDKKDEDAGEKDGDTKDDAKDNKGDGPKNDTDDDTKDNDESQEEKGDGKQGKDGQGDNINDKVDGDAKEDQSNETDGGNDNKGGKQDENDQAEEQTEEAEQTTIATTTAVTQTSGTESAQPSATETNGDAESGAVRYRPFFGII